MSGAGDIAVAVLDELTAIAPEIAAVSVARDRPLADQLDLDSMDWQRLLAALAARFSVELPDADAATLRTIDELARYLAEHTRA